MKFLRFPDPLVSLLYEDDDIIAVDKAYGLDTHTNDSKSGNEDFLIPGLIELFELQLARKLHIVHRLDQTTTGVIVFAKTPEAAKIYQDFFRHRETQKTYSFITDREVTAAQLSCADPIVHKGAALEASTDFVRLSREGNFSVWEARPRTGRNHQIRIHAAALGIPLLGDEKYGGTRYPFLCLHNRRIKFPNGVVIESGPPRHFEEPSLLRSRELAQVLFEVDRRQRLFGKHGKGQCFRLAQRGAAGDFTLDQLGSVLLLNWFGGEWSSSNQSVFTEVSARLSLPILVRLLTKKTPSGKPQALFLTGAGESHDLSGAASVVADGWTAHEGTTQFDFRADAGPTAGLFPEQRLQRSWLGSQVHGRSVLVTFAGPCSFGVIAKLGGASEIACVDAGKNNLNWGRANFELNGLDVENVKFFCRDSVSFLEQCRTKKQKFDFIVADVPGFFRRDSGVFKIESGLSPFVAAARECLLPGGSLLLSTSYESLSIDELRRLILAGAGTMRVELFSVQPPLDIELPGDRASQKTFLMRLTH